MIATAYVVPGTILGAGTWVLVNVLGVAALFGAVGMGSSEESMLAGMLLLWVLMVLARVLIFAVALVYAAAVTYLAPISMLIYADEGDLRPAFSPERLKEVGFSTDYALPWLAFGGTGLLVYAGVWFLSLFLIGYLFVPFLPLLYFYGGIAGFYVLATVYQERVAGATVTEDPDPNGMSGEWRQIDPGNSPES